MREKLGQLVADEVPVTKRPHVISAKIRNYFVSSSKHGKDASMAAICIILCTNEKEKNRRNIMYKCLVKSFTSSKPTLHPFPEATI